MLSPTPRSRGFPPMSHERKESPSSSALTIDVDTARRQFYQLLELLPCAAYTCDHKGLITFFNRLAKELWGREPALNHPSELYCGSYRLFEKSGALIPRQDGVVARVLRENNSSAAGEFVIQQLEGKKLTCWCRLLQCTTTLENRSV